MVVMRMFSDVVMGLTPKTSIMRFCSVTVRSRLFVSRGGAPGVGDRVGVVTLGAQGDVRSFPLNVIFSVAIAVAVPALVTGAADPRPLLMAFLVGCGSGLAWWPPSLFPPGRN